MPRASASRPSRPHLSLQSDAEASRHREILDAIADLRAHLERSRPPAQALTALASAPPARQRPADAFRLQTELAAILEAIDGVKREIDGLRRDHRLLDSVRERALAGGDPYDVLAGATDSANAAILASAERIDDLVNARALSAGADETRALDEIGEHLVRIFEACNVHDFASLRVSHFLMTMKRIEDRVRGLCDLIGVRPAPADDDDDEPVSRLHRLAKRQTGS